MYYNLCTVLLLYQLERWEPQKNQKHQKQPDQVKQKRDFQSSNTEDSSKKSH